MSTSAGPPSQRDPPSSSTPASQLASSSFEPTTFSAESYFATQPAPATLARDLEGVRAFVKRCRERGQRVVLITVRDVFCPASDRTYKQLQSGGTTVPLELNVCVSAMSCEAAPPLHAMRASHLIVPLLIHGPSVSASSTTSAPGRVARPPRSTS